MGRTILLATAALAACLFVLLQARPVSVADGPSGRIACLSYAPYLRGQTPFDPTLVIPPAQIEADMALLAGVTDCVRTYATGQGLDAVPAIAARHGLKTLAGAWIGRDAAENAAEVTRLIALAKAHPESLKGVVVGNEVLLRGEQTPEGLAAYIRQVRAAVPESVPVTTADVWEFWERNATLAAEVDLVTVHILPYWEDHPVAVEAAVVHVMETWRHMAASFAPKPVLIGETGWPTAGRRRADAEPGQVAQARFVRGILAAAHAQGADYNLIEAFDQPWKRALEGTVGGAWGIFTAERALKHPVTGPVTERPAAPLWLAGAVTLGLLPAAAAALAGGRRRAVPLLAAAGVFCGAVLVLQLWHLLDASRSWDEWAVNLGWLAASVVMAVAGARALAGMPCRLAVAPLRHLAVAGMAVASLGLVFDSRYRDLPVSMFLIPAVLFALLPVAERSPREHRAVALLLTACSVGVLVNEGWLNTHAWAWTLTGLALAGPVLLSGAGAARRRPTADGAAPARSGA